MQAEWIQLAGSPNRFFYRGYPVAKIMQHQVYLCVGTYGHHIPITDGNLIMARAIPERVECYSCDTWSSIWNTIDCQDWHKDIPAEVNKVLLLAERTKEIDKLELYTNIAEALLQIGEDIKNGISLHFWKEE